MEEGLNGLNSLSSNGIFASDDKIKSELTIPGPQRIFYLADAIRKGWKLEKIYSLTKIDYWFLDQISELIQIEIDMKKMKLKELDKEVTINKAMSSDINKQYLDNTDIAYKNGVFGSPTFIHDGEVFWGDDRLEDCIKWIKSK